jgi:hypothetical protein
MTEEQDPDAQKRRTEQLIEEHYAELDRIGYIENPTDTIRNALDHVVFAVFLSEAIRSGAITPATLKRAVRVHTGGPGLTIEKEATSDWLTGGGWNLLLSALAVSAQATDRALDDTFGPRPLDRRPAPRPEDLSDLEAARVIIYMIRCAFAHDPFNPRWACRGAYQGTFRVAEMGVSLDTGSLSGERVKPEDHGGIEGYIQLLVFVLSKVQTHSNQLKADSANTDSQSGA